MVVYFDLAANPRGAIIVAVLWTMTTLSGLFLGLRLYSKLARTRQLWWDDCVIIVAWILLVVSCSTSTANARLGFGLHTPEVPFENLIPFGLQSNISAFASIIAVACSKTSFGLTLLRLTDGWMKWLIIGLLVLLNVTQYLSAVFFWVSCNPPAKTWNPLLPGECWPISVTVNMGLSVGACSALCDFALALLPWRLLLRFNMYNREKIGVAIAMSMGVFAGISCIIKMTTIPVFYEGDFSYNSLPLVVWGFIEPSLTIMAASIPFMRHLFKSARSLPTTAAATATTTTPPNGTDTNPRPLPRTSVLAAAGANSNDNINNKSNHDNDNNEKTATTTEQTQTQRRNWSRHQQEGHQHIIEGRLPNRARGEDERSDCSILARRAAPGSVTSEGTAGMSECGSGRGEKGVVSPGLGMGGIGRR